MRSDWILDVLADLRTFALSIDLPALAEQLDDTALVAMAEIASAPFARTLPWRSRGWPLRHKPVTGN
jgi:hypothetical protein